MDDVKERFDLLAKVFNILAEAKDSNLTGAVVVRITGGKMHHVDVIEQQVGNHGVHATRVSESQVRQTLTDCTTVSKYGDCTVRYLDGEIYEVENRTVAKLLNK